MRYGEKVSAKSFSFFFQDIQIELLSAQKTHHGRFQKDVNVNSAATQTLILHFMSQPFRPLAGDH